MYTQKPSEFYRKAVYEMCQAYTGSTDQEFELFLREVYESEKALLNEESPDYLDLSIPAVGLLAFGDLSMVDDILRSIPPLPQDGPGGLIFRLGSMALSALLPIDIDVRRNPEIVKEWYETHKDRLRWDEKKGVFVLGSSS